MAFEEKLSTDPRGCIWITYTAIPCPIPEPFRRELIRAATDAVMRERVTLQIKGNCGVKVRRRAYPSVSDHK